MQQSCHFYLVFIIVQMRLYKVIFRIANELDTYSIMYLEYKILLTVLSYVYKANRLNTGIAL